MCSDAANTRLRAGLDKIDEFVKIYQLPSDLTADLRRTHKVRPLTFHSCVESSLPEFGLQELWRIHKGIDMNLLIDDFPKSLQMRTRMVRSLALLKISFQLSSRW